jgi:ribosome production factor 1
LENTRIYDSTSYLTSDPKVLQAAAERAAEASRLANEEPEEDDEDEEGMSVDEEDEEDEDEIDEDEAAPEAGPSNPKVTLPQTATDGEEAAVDGEDAEQPEEPQVQLPMAPPRILLTTSAASCKDTYTFCEDLKNVFPGGEFFKRPKGRGFELGRVSRWAAKRGFNAMIVVNEDHKKPSESKLDV